MQSLRTFAPALVLAALVACGDDDQPLRAADGGGGGATAATSTTGGPGVGGQGGGQGGGDGGSGGEGGQGGGGGAPACGAGIALADLEAGAWDRRFTIPGFTGHDGFAPAVHDFAIDEDGSVVATGRFQYLEGERVDPLLRHRDGGWEAARSTWEIEAPLDGFSAIAIGDDGALALATNDSFGERDGSIWIDDGEGLRSIGDFQGQVRSLAFWGDRLWAAGLFAIGDGAPAEGLAVWDGAAWSAPPGGPLVASDVGAAAFELLAEDEALLVAGAFAGVGGVPAANVAAFDGASWTALDLDGAMVVYALARTGDGVLHAGGALGPIDVPGGVARWTGDAWEIVGGGLAQYATRGVVTDLAAVGDGVAATGCFSTAGGLMEDPTSIPAQSVALWTGAAWEPLDGGDEGVLAPFFQPFVCGDEGLTAVWEVPHQRLAHDGARLYLGGYFPGVDGVLSQSIAVHDGEGWLAQGAPGNGVGGSIDLVAAGGDGCGEIVGLGLFTHLGGEPVDARAARWTGDGWAPLSDPLPYDAFCPGLDVSASGEVAVACMVFPPGEPEGVILARDGDALVPRDVEVPGPVSAVRWIGDTLWVAGTGPSSWIGRVSGGALEVLADDLDAPASHIDASADDDVIVAGAFSHIGGADALRIARWDGDGWSALGEGLAGQVTALGRDGDVILASNVDEGAGALLLGRFDLDAPGDGWVELAGADTGVTPESFHSLNAIRPVEGGLLVAGSVAMDDGSGRGVLLFEEGAFRPLGGGVGAIGIGGVAITGDAVWVAGTIGEVGAGAGEEGVSSVGVARWDLQP